MEVILKRTKITGSILKQTLISTRQNLENGEILGWCFYDKTKYIVFYESNTNKLTKYPFIEKIKSEKHGFPNADYTGTIYEYWIKVQYRRGVVTYTCKEEKEKDDFVKKLNEIIQESWNKGQFFI